MCLRMIYLLYYIGKRETINFDWALFGFDHQRAVKCTRTYGERWQQPWVGDDKNKQKSAKSTSYFNVSAVVDPLSLSSSTDKRAIWKTTMSFYRLITVTNVLGVLVRHFKWSSLITLLFDLQAGNFIQRDVLWTNFVVRDGCI